MLPDQTKLATSMDHSVAEETVLGCILMIECTQLYMLIICHSYAYSLFCCLIVARNAALKHESMMQVSAKFEKRRNVEWKCCKWCFVLFFFL